MKILGIDSSGMTASVAVVEDENLVAEYTVNYKKTHSQTLVPMIDEIARMTELDLGTLDGIAIAKGPGSFTGLRIGSATAKGLGLALGLNIAEIPTTEGLAYNFVGTGRLVCPLMDARREQVYTGLYDFDGVKLNTVSEAEACPVEDIIARVNELGRPVIFLGDGVKVYKAKVEELCRVDYIFAPASRINQSGASIATLGVEYFKAGKTVPASEHVPDYLRLSQAERERNEAANAD